MRSDDQRFNLFALLDFTGGRAGDVGFLGGLQAADQALLFYGHFLAPFCFCLVLEDADSWSRQHAKVVAPCENQEMLKTRTLVPKYCPFGQALG
jgi:hypothetical protein